MATVYSLVCWGGRDGRVVTFTDFGDVVNLNSHGLRTGMGIQFSGGTLPTGLFADTTYYIREGADINKFTLYTTIADALSGTNQVTFTGAGSGTRVAKSLYRLGLTAGQLARYGSSGNERIYEGLYAWRTAMSSLLTLAPALNDTYVCEVGEAFDEITSATCSFDLKCAASEIVSKVNGVRSAAFHGGVPGSGYVFKATGTQTALYPNMYNCVIDGLEVYYTGVTVAVSLVSQGALACYGTVRNMILHGTGTAAGRGLASLNSSWAYNNIIYDLNIGIYIGSYSGLGTYYDNNTVTKCLDGVKSLGSNQGILRNNLVIGNVTNYNAFPAYASFIGICNAGEPVDIKSASIDVAVNAKQWTCAAHGRYSTNPVIFKTTGTLPTIASTGLPLEPDRVYYCYTRTTTDVFTLCATQGGTELSFSDNGVGTHSIVNVYSTDLSYLLVDFSVPNNVFRDYANNDFRAAGSAGVPNVAAIQVDSGIELTTSLPYDIVDGVRPNYNFGVNEKWDVGAFEFDRGNGLAPAQVEIRIDGIIPGSTLAIYKSSDRSVITPAMTIGADGIYSTTYSYTGDVQVLIRIRKSTDAPKYQPYEYLGTITSLGLSLTASQIPDTIA